MANFMISSLLAPVVPGGGLDLKAQLPAGGAGCFALHLDRRIQEGLAGQGNLVGVAAKEKPVLTESFGPTDPPPSVAAVLQQLMVDLKAVVEKPAAEPGEWTFQLQDLGHLQKLAVEAGMAPTLLAPLRKAMEEGKGLPLADLLTALAENFKAQDQATEVTVAETCLPLLETFLSKLAVPPETIQHLDGQGVNGVDRLDLIAYLKGMRSIAGQDQGQDGPQTFVLSEWEVEQFSAMLAEAGVPAAGIEQILPERPSLAHKALAGLRPEEGNLPVTMSLPRLESALQQAVAAVGAARPKVDLPGFFEELNTVLGLSGFESSDVGWSPVVQGTMSAAYDELREMIDQAMVRVESISGAEADALGLERMLRELEARQDLASGLTTDDEAASLSREGLIQALRQAVAVVDQYLAPGATSQAEPLVQAASSQSELLTQINSALAPSGLELTQLPPASVPPQVEALPPAPVAVDQLRDLFARALGEVQGAPPQAGQAGELPEIIDRVNTILAPAGILITAAGAEAIIPQPQEVPHPLPYNAIVDQTAVNALDPGVEAETSAPQEFTAQVVSEQLQTILAQPGMETSDAVDLLDPLIPAPATGEPRSTSSLAKGREERGDDGPGEEEALPDRLLTDSDEVPPEPATDPTGEEQVGAGPGEEFEPVETTVPRGGERRDEQTRGVVAMEAKSPEQVQTDAVLKGQALRPRLTPELQQFAFEQISQGVLRGLRNNDHHLALTLYPKELGEVKVDMQIRGNHLSVTFVMENQRVKEAMEASMGEFKDNLERRGFSLGAMSVSVDQQGQNDGGKRFMAAWEQMQVVRHQQEGGVTPKAGLLPANSGNSPIRTQQGGISLFV